MGTVREPLKILSLDGGGIRGKSSLMILEHIMDKIRDSQGLDHNLHIRPCEYFDLIGGTSTGGIIAIMLGRLRMTVDECIQAYEKVAQQAFTPKKAHLLSAPSKGRFSARSLEAAMKQIIREYCVEPECAARRSQGDSTAETCSHSETLFRDHSCTKTVVLAITQANVDTGPTLLKTYDKSNSLRDCTIWQVARATSAATTFFKSIKLGRDNIEFIDAGLGYNNPCEELIEEAKQIFPECRDMRILSIGTGVQDVNTADKTWLSIVETLKKMATTSKTVADRLEKGFYGTGQYYRFNVDRGLQGISLSDYMKAAIISAHTSNYLRENERAIREFVNRVETTPNEAEEATELPFRTAPAGSETAELAAASQGPWSHLPLSENSRFVGRGEILAMLDQKLFAERRQSIALVGLGGVGKTQVALEFAYAAKKAHPELSIFWVPALSGATFEQAYIELARELPIQKRSEDEDAKESLRRFLSSKAAGPWLFIVDNADDADVVFGSANTSDGISRLLPKSVNGRILFTTRSREVAVELAEPDVIELHEMNHEEAISLFEKCLTQKDLIKDTAVNILLSELVHLPLAIVQAAAYLNKNQISCAEYLGLLHCTEDNMVRLLSREFRDSTRYVGSQNAVATTWLVSFEQIRKTDNLAAKLLSFFSCIEPKAIPRSLVPKIGAEEEMVQAIGTLRGYAFLVRRDEGDLFDMHSLVHVATKVWLEAYEREEEAQVDAIEHLVAVFPSSDRDSREIWRAYLPHALRLLSKTPGCSMEKRYDLLSSVGCCLYTDRRFKESITCLAEVCRWREGFNENDHSRLASEHDLASAYLSDRRIKEAISIFEHVVAVRKQILVEDDQSRLASENDLASAYLDNGQTQEAIKILKHVVAVQKQSLAEDDNGRLAPEHELAKAYTNNQQTQEAIKILKRIVAVRKQTLAEDDHGRLASEHELARAYTNNQQPQEAIEILKHVVAVQKQTLTEDDCYRLTSEHELARAYLYNRQTQEAIEILKHVVAVWKQTIAEDDQYRLGSEYVLARAYDDEGLVEEAIALMAHVVKLREKMLVEDDPELLTAQHNLALMLEANEQIEKARALLEHVVDVDARTLAEGHPDRLVSQRALARITERIVK